MVVLFFVLCVFLMFFGVYIQIRNSTKGSRAQNYVNGLSDAGLKAAILKAQYNRSPLSDEEIVELLNTGNNFFAIKCNYDGKDIFHWVLKNGDRDPVIQVTFNHELISLPFLGFLVLELSKSNLIEHPPELIYTGATVGGVSTGGFHIQEGYLSERFTSSGVHGLFTYYKDDFGTEKKLKVEEIYLCKALVDKVPEDAKKFLVGQKLLLRYDRPLSEQKQNDLALAVSSQNIRLYHRIVEDQFLRTQLSLVECLTISRWMKGLTR